MSAVPGGVYAGDLLVFQGGKTETAFVAHLHISTGETQPVPE